MALTLKNRLHVVMGVAGCGKSTIGEALAEATGGRYLEGDAFHPKSNIDKMSRGEPLTDHDRWPWLKALTEEMYNHEGTLFMGCSALKLGYRYVLSMAPEGVNGEPVCFIHLKGSRELIAKRMGERTGHFMPLDLLDSQFATLEEIQPQENAVVVDIDRSTEDIVRSVLDQIKS
ncbi:MAG: gluconokinase [Pseudomonadota bacterium]